jgi:hypothetical protein
MAYVSFQQMGAWSYRVTVLEFDQGVSAVYTEKKVSNFPVPSRDVIYQTFPCREK